MWLSSIAIRIRLRIHIQQETLIYILYPYKESKCIEDRQSLTKFSM